MLVEIVSPQAVHDSQHAHGKGLEELSNVPFTVTTSGVIFSTARTSATHVIHELCPPKEERNSQKRYNSISPAGSANIENITNCAASRDRPDSQFLLLHIGEALLLEGQSSAPAGL